MPRKPKNLPVIDPCPFCGSEAELVDHALSNNTTVACFNCGCAGPTADKDLDAIRLWNDRIKPEIIVRKMPGNHDGYQTTIKNNECYWGCGKSTDAAIGSVIQSHPEQFGISIKREF